MNIKIAQGLSLPESIVTQAVGILAQRRAGKSFCARRIVEQLHHAGQQVVVVDPKGDWWGIRSAADGKEPGLPILILGGEHKDAPLEKGSGEIVAKLVVEERVSIILDLSEFRKSEIAVFMADFLETMYRLKAREANRTPVMLMIDEADAIAPQRPPKGHERMLGAAEDIVRRGGQRGIGCMMVTQRSAVLNKNVLTQIQLLICLRTIAPQDLEALNEWVDVHGTEEQRKALMASLPSLPTGDAWFWSPGWPTHAGVFQRAHVLPIETFDSGATPDGHRVTKAARADVDLEALKRQMAETIERAEANDPKLLRVRISELEREIAEHSCTTEAGDPVPVLTDENIAVIGALEQSARDMLEVAKEVRSAYTDAGANINGLLNDVQELAANVDDFKLSLATRAEAAPQINPPRISEQHSHMGNNGRTTMHRTPAPARTAATARATGPSSEMKGGKFREMLIALAQAKRPLADHQLSARAAMALSGTFDTYIGQHRANGWVEGPRSSLKITASGLRALGPFEPLPTGKALRDLWLSKLGSGKKREMLRVLIEAYPRALPDEQVAARAGMSLSGTFDTYIGHLRALMLVEGTRRELRASDGLFQ